MKIDAHVHIGDWSEFGISFSLAKLVKVMKEWEIEQAVVMPSLVGDRITANKVLLNHLYESPKFIFFAWVDGATTQSELEGYRGLEGLKFHPSISQTSIVKMHESLEYADQHNLPFLYHAGRTPISWPDRLMSIVPSYPKTRFILGHAGGTAYDRAVDTLQRWPSLPENVWAEISTVRWPELLKRMVETWGEDHIIHGSDLPFVDPRLHFDCLRYAGLLQNEKIMGQNLYKLLRR